jgi:N-acetylglucosaminyldiphosphoundecaprenol N-acetyl-beta-D-mannosaminyltransferase
MEKSAGRDMVAVTSDERTAYLAGVKVSTHTKRELLEAISAFVAGDRQALVFSGNLHSLNLAHKIPWLKDALNAADVVRNDSAGVKLAGRLVGKRIPERNTWADFGWALAEWCETKGHSLFLLGNKPGVPETARERLSEKYPELKIVGVRHGYFEKRGEENDRVVAAINQAAPDILVVGFGMPLQERWILDNRDRLDANVIMTCGNCFAFLAGMERRAPKWMRSSGLEWLFRLLKEPRRLFKRYVIGIPAFYFRLFFRRG